MNNNRGNNRRRSRPNNNRQQHGGQPVNRIDSRARGNAPQMLEKYRKLALDAHLNGDRVNEEYYLQFADHYFRVLADTRLRQEEARARREERWQENQEGHPEAGASSDHSEGGNVEANANANANAFVQRRDDRYQGDNRDYRETRDYRDNRDQSDNRDMRDTRDYRDNRDNRETRDYRDNREYRDQREYRERAPRERVQRAPREFVREAPREFVREVAPEAVAQPVEPVEINPYEPQENPFTRSNARTRQATAERRPRRPRVAAPVAEVEHAPVLDSFDISALPPAISLPPEEPIVEVAPVEEEKPRRRVTRRPRVAKVADAAADEAASAE